MQVAEGESKEFLGQEFLTWLWYYGEKNDWKIELNRKELIEYGFDLEEQEMKELLVFQPSTLRGCIPRLQGQETRKSQEADASLKQGKILAIAKMWVIYDSHEWIFTCRGDRFGISGLTLSTMDSTSAEERFQGLAQNFELFNEVFDKMYEFFLERRLSPSWQKKELPAILQWIQNRAEVE